LPLRLERLEPRDLPANTLSIGDAVLTEGNSGSANMVFTLTRTGDTTTDWTVHYQTVAGTAVGGSDYTPQSGTATIPAGSATGTISVPILGDTLDEKNENFSVVLNGPVSTGGAPVTVAPRQSFATQATPVAVESGDLNGDGKPDLVVANRDSGTVSVFLNTTAAGAGTVTFGTRQDIITGGADPQDLVVTDLNGDGKPDIAVVHKYTTYYVTVMLNLTAAGDTTFSFGPRTNFNTSPRCQSLVAGDVNGDGKPDLLSASTTGGIFNVLLNQTANGAVTPVFTSGGAPNGSGMAGALIDLDGDGKTDLVGFGGASITVRLNNTPGGGSLSFASPQGITTSPQTAGIAVADVNGDGKPDFITTSYTLNVVSVLLNTTMPGAATVTVSDRFDFDTLPKPVGVRLVAVDGDTQPDLLVSCYGSGAIGGGLCYLRNTTAVGAAVPSFAAHVDLPSGAGARSPLAADFNQDGLPDTAEVDRFDNTLSILVQTGGVTITDNTGVGTIVDDDTYLATGADAGGGPHVRVFDAATGAERFSFFAYGATFTGGVRVAVGDVTGDGVADIITAAGPGGGPHVKVFSGVDGSLVASFFAYGASFSGGVFLAVGNFDADPQLEIVTGAGAGGGPHVRVFDVAGGTGTPLPGFLGGFFAYGASFTGGVSVAAGNVDGAGFDEVITGAGAGGGPHVKAFRTDGTLAASFFAYSAAFSGGVNVAAGDVNGDGTAEIITGPGAGGGQSVKVFRADATVVANFVPYAGFDGAVRVAFDSVGGVAEIVTGPGSGWGPRVRRFHGTTLALLGEFDAYSPAFLGGIFVGGD
jgi:hypothetical protein